MMNIRMHQHHHHQPRMLESNIWDGIFDDITDHHDGRGSFLTGQHHQHHGGFHPHHVPQQPQHLYSPSVSSLTATTDDYSSRCASSPSLPASPTSSSCGYSDSENVSNSPVKSLKGGAKRVIASGNKRVKQRSAANMRERKRMKSINDAFEGLRTRIPLVRGDKKLSKVDTLRSAIDYIHELSQLLQSCGDQFGAGFTEKKKVIVRCNSEDMYDECGQQLYGHSLSWINEDELQFGPNNTLKAKVWMPEDPRDTGEMIE